MIITQINDPRVMTDFPKSGHICVCVCVCVYMYVCMLV